MKNNKQRALCALRRSLSFPLAALLLSACGGEPEPGAVSSAQSSSAQSSSSNGNTNSLSQQAFKETLYPILKDNCSICHNQNGIGVPPHGDNNLATAHEAASSVVDLNTPEFSRIVSRLRVDKHNCWINCDAAADTAEQAIRDWKSALDGNPVVKNCEPEFPRDLILLSDLPFVKSIKSMLGGWVAYGRTEPDAATKLFSQKGTVANTSLLNTRLEWAAHVTGEFQRRAAQISGCMQADRSCARDYIQKTAHRAFKRPVTQTEVSELMAVFDEGAISSFTYGIKLAVQAILVSPSFNHRTEYGELNADGNYELTPHEYASTISFLLTDSLPDEELLAAAESGALSNPAERESQTMRLLSLDSTKESVESTLLSAWSLGNLFGKVKDRDTFPEYSPLLAAQMYEETRLFLRKHLWGGGLTNVLSSRTTYVNKALADLYNIPFPGNDPSQFEEVNINDGRRAGLLTQASLLTAYSRTDETSVVARGLFVNGPLLCLPRVPPPPEDIVAEIEQQLSSDSTEVERAEFRAATEPCKNCHAHFDAYGLMFEQYDAIGGFRELNERGEAIHAGVDLSNMAEFNGYVSGPVEFADMLAGREEFVQCVTRHLLAYGTGENGIQRNQCDVTDITDNLSNQSTLTDIIRSIATSPALSTRISEAN